ncbi:MAG: SHOCT domain-containing protein [Deltaproteobacteria bacterium]|nr:SHOCT domain-containing protein [Deltaproteobacteria bacterium]
MGRFFSRFKFKEPDPTGASWGNISSFYGLLIFLTVIPFILIVALVWLTGILGFNAYIFAGFAVLLTFVVYRLYRSWSRFKKKLAAHGGEFQDLVREATRTGKDVEITLLSGFLTLRTRGQQSLFPEGLPQAAPPPLALTGPDVLEAETVAVHSHLDPERVREELEEFSRLKDSGVITPEEFDRIKAGLLQRI